tara:strand:+ start:7020 stop:7769 length:750 start_codon:yes stop_codon:yes gene_type:complete
MKTVIGNWKLNPQSFLEAKRLFEATKKVAHAYKNTNIIIAPPAVFLYALTKGYRGTRVEFGAQGVSKELTGSHTGAISALQLRDVGATVAIIGHAEQRAEGLTNEEVRAQVAACLEGRLDPIVAVGEKERDTQGNYVAFVREQLAEALRDVSGTKFKNITIAYEPVWAIGAPDAPSAMMVHQMILLVRKLMVELYGERAMKAVRIVYGGAINEDNAKDILAIPGLHGVLVGRASLDPVRLEEIVKVANE